MNHYSRKVLGHQQIHNDLFLQLFLFLDRHILKRSHLTIIDCRFTDQTARFIEKISQQGGFA